MSYAKYAVPMALGLSLATITAFVVYYVLKKDEEEEPKEKKIRTSRLNVIEITVPKSIVPALIGRSGSNVKEIEKKTGATVNFKQLNDTDYDVCIIRGRSDASQLAETMVHEFIKNQPVIVEDHLSVPGWACGRIIGTGGENINDMSHRSGARIKIEGGGPQDYNTMRNITIKGTTEQIDVAKKLIEACVAQEKCRREIELSKRAPRHAQAASPTASNKSDVTDLTGDKKPHAHVAKKSEVGPGAAIEVYVSAVSSPSRFWLQFVGPQVAQLDELVNTMTEYYSDKERREAHELRSVSVGQIVAAVFRHDGRWYRARVTDIKPNEFDPTQQVADVFYVDYGDSEYVATHELCELRADLLRLRFQAMECFLAGVVPVHEEGESRDCERWSAPAIERFEQLTQVARWQPLVSKTCTYKKTSTGDGDKEREIPGVKLFDMSDGELDIAATLIAEGWAAPAPASPRTSPPRQAPSTPFGDLGNSRVLGILMDRNERSSSLPKDHERADQRHNGTTGPGDAMPTSKSVSSGLESNTKNSPAKLSYPEHSKQTNGSHEDFLQSERQHLDREKSSTETLTDESKHRNEMKANMNRIDSHHGNLQSLGKLHETHK